jgi:hypothetical protein
MKEVDGLARDYRLAGIEFLLEVKQSKRLKYKRIL